MSGRMWLLTADPLNWLSRRGQPLRKGNRLSDKSITEHVTKFHLKREKSVIKDRKIGNVVCIDSKSGWVIDAAEKGELRVLDGALVRRWTQSSVRKVIDLLLLAIHFWSPALVSLFMMASVTHVIKFYSCVSGILKQGEWAGKKTECAHMTRAH